MGPEKVYTQKEVDDLLLSQRDQLEAKHFEEQTKEVLHEINKRLNESNNYKATIGKDVREVKQEVQDVKQRLADLEEARLAYAQKIKEDLEARQKQEDSKRKWWQDWWIRAGITGTIIWEIVNIYQANAGSIHQALHGTTR